MYIEGYGVVGYASFNGPAANIQGALAQAKKVGATFVVANRRYTNTISGAIPLVTPTSQTSYVNGTANAYGSGGYASGTYTGTVTTYGTETSYMPYSVAHFDQQAVFFAPMKRTALGIMTRTLTTEEVQALGSAKGLFVRVVRRGSPAYQADILPGDILRQINGVVADDPNGSRQLLHLDAVNHVVLTRSGKMIEKDILVPAAW
jgi:S1-C subfamily serine protease